MTRRNRNAADRYVLALALASLTLVGGCRQATTPSDYTTLSGTVIGLSADTDCELTVKTARQQGLAADAETVPCLLTKDTEIYINDRLSTFDAIVMGDAVELIGYRQSNPRGERFILVFAYITRNEPPPPEPDLTPPATQPAATTQET